MKMKVILRIELRESKTENFIYWALFNQTKAGHIESQSKKKKKKTLLEKHCFVILKQRLFPTMHNNRDTTSHELKKHEKFTLVIKKKT